MVIVSSIFAALFTIVGMNGFDGQYARAQGDSETTVVVLPEEYQPSESEDEDGKLQSTTSDDETETVEPKKPITGMQFRGSPLTNSDDNCDETAGLPDMDNPLSLKVSGETTSAGQSDDAICDMVNIGADNETPAGQPVMDDPLSMKVSGATTDEVDNIASEQPDTGDPSPSDGIENSAANSDSSESRTSSPVKPEIVTDTRSESPEN
jgi:hypothetical protein